MAVYDLFLMGIHLGVADRILEKSVFFCTSLHPDNGRLRANFSTAAPKLPTFLVLLGRIFILETFY
jgi:hypothetical protein